ncbi:MAG: Cysteine desulfurase, SufS subfamily [Candidatus Gottesmanbacteria bacterium GW2011_GWA2_44_17]|uniref:cysteine desulfurase n=3 Tax=Candidatus Gottesmaniibacteriota TaxID=1752720 RepID=A0A0G1INW2_9BACT|nr:MAG: Cysteine desulfurase, SufS subfamily [Microgenomates group bacterium GW2011_GWC1_43_11]KKT38326.1 MAG: Cysteine desulfurase, SufS subfamily [Candidatus Gottesmanbacteria bacterium GW2011_GWB1_44_11c]KKT47923.1 MAG: Cysteine desulfurase, SufS subfamily [Candidatus Gottesmanbacteria bacterium GW2011_GWA2_44_17]KKT61081.1 MAG: Cysteine desulfurase, SufS subfamily [Candidatus Gottesmanbacteria bacterium GW2011_GWA1_44_24b]
MIDVSKIKQDFPLFKRKINGKRIVYLDSTASSLKPKKVIDAVNGYYKRYTANVFRSIYKTSEEATAKYEQAREYVADFIHAKNTSEIVFTRNTDESLSLLVYSWLPYHVRQGDVLVTSILEHHANFVPWQQYALKNKCDFRIWNADRNGILSLEAIEKLVSKRTKLFTFTAASNVLGTLPPVKKIIEKVKEMNPLCLTVVDAAQAVPHLPVDVENWGADVVAFSGHKMMAPSGIGVLWAKEQLLEEMPPFLFGGDMIKEVHEKTTVFNDIPHKFEAGTPFIEGAIGLGAAVEYLSALGMRHVREHEKKIVSYALDQLTKIPGLTMYGPADPDIRGGVVAFQMKGIHPHDIAQVLDEDNICIRVGYHCAMPLHEYLAIGPTCRASFYVYNDTKDVDALAEGLKKVKKMFE